MKVVNEENRCCSMGELGKKPRRKQFNDSFDETLRILNASFDTGLSQRKFTYSEDVSKHKTNRRGKGPFSIWSSRDDKGHFLDCCEDTTPPRSNRIVVSKQCLNNASESSVTLN